jgi:hypothetical protein
MMPQILPGLREVRTQVTQATERIQTDNAALPADQRKSEAELKRAIAARSKQIEQAPTATSTTIQELGGFCGRLLFAVLAVIIVSRRSLLRVFVGPGLIVMPVAFAVLMQQDLLALRIGIFLAALLTIGQFSFWGNYLPRVFPLHLRGTGESFAANIGGRMMLRRGNRLLRLAAVDAGRHASSSVRVHRGGRRHAGLRGQFPPELLPAGAAGRGATGIGRHLLRMAGLSMWERAA